MRALELFSGIGGFASAAGRRCDIVGAVDHDRRAASVYTQNFEHPVFIKNLVSVKDDWLASFEADLWWMSPPCTPHGVRGTQSDVNDRRSHAFLRLLEAVSVVRPRWIALENVVGFQGSVAHTRLVRVLEEAGYSFVEGVLCPSALDIPASRKRYYLVAGLTPVVSWPAPVPSLLPRPLADFIAPWEESLAVDLDKLGRFKDAFHVVDPKDPYATSACFTRAYGKSPVYVGSYLKQSDGVRERLRYLSPNEIATLYGFRDDFSFGELPFKLGWRLIGNSVSVDAVRHVLRAIPEWRV